MIERTVKLTLSEGIGHMMRKQNFIITIGENGAEIRSARAPIVDRDKTVVAYVGSEPTVSAVVLRVEEQL